MSPEDIQAEIDRAEYATLPLDELKPWPENPRTNMEEGSDRLRNTIGAVGWGADVLIQKSSNRVIGGHLRLMAARKLGLERIPCKVLDVGDARANEMALSDNQASTFAQFEPIGLGKLLAELEKDQRDALGWSQQEYKKAMREMNKALNAQRKIVDDIISPPPKTPITRFGDRWSLGRHTLVCDDSVRIDIPSADLCFTDPPYGADIEYNSHDDSQRNLETIIRGFFERTRAVCKNVALTPGINNVFAYPKPDWILCWYYGAGTGRTPWGFTSWQPIMVYGSDPKLATGEGCHPDAFQFLMTPGDADENRQIKHACPKPLSVWIRFLERLTNADSRKVFEPFAGSGTTIMACEHSNLDCFAVEIDPAYCDVAVERWEGATGGKATRR